MKSLLRKLVGGENLIKNRINKLESKLKHRNKPKLFIISSNWEGFCRADVARDENELYKKVIQKYGCKSAEELEQEYKVVQIHFDFKEVSRSDDDKLIVEDVGDGKIYFMDYIA